MVNSAKFDGRTEFILDKNVRGEKVWQVLLNLFGCLLPISFGMMLGWPNIAYPKLLSSTFNDSRFPIDPRPPVPITLSQSAMVAGMLMIGVILGTLVSCSGCLKSKRGVILGATLATTGWTVMIFAKNMTGLCVSRVFVGLGFGLGMVKLKQFIADSCEPDIVQQLQLIAGLSVNLGVTLICIIGINCSFRLTSLISTCFPFVVILVYGCAPKTSVERLTQKRNNVFNALIKDLDDKVVPEGVQQLQVVMHNKEENPPSKSTVILLTKWREFLLIFWMVLMQQFSGGASLMIYSVVNFTELGVLHSKYTVIAYMVTMFLGAYLGSRHFPHYKRKPIMIMSAMFSTICLGAVLAYIALAPFDEFYSTIPLTFLLVYAFVHTAGFASVPALVITDRFRKQDRLLITGFLTITTSLFGLIATKVYQVLLQSYGVFAPISMFALVSLAAFFLIIIFFDETATVKRTRIT